MASASRHVQPYSPHRVSAHSSGHPSPCGVRCSTVFPVGAGGLTHVSKASFRTASTALQSSLSPHFAFRRNRRYPRSSFAAKASSPHCASMYAARKSLSCGTARWQSIPSLPSSIAPASVSGRSTTLPAVRDGGNAASMFSGGGVIAYDADGVCAAGAESVVDLKPIETFLTSSLDSVTCHCVTK